MPRPGESEYTVDNSSFQALQEKVRGQVITSDQADYDTARAVFNGMIDKRPAAILRVSQVADAIAGVNFARDTGLDLALRGGGGSGARILTAVWGRSNLRLAVL